MVVARRPALVRLLTTGTALAAVTVLGAGAAVAAPDTGSNSGSSVPAAFQEDPGPLPELRDIETAAIVGETPVAERAVRLTVASPALRRDVGVEVLLPADNSAPRPTLFLLDGVSARNHTSGWMNIGGAPAFFADKNVNVVMPNGGRGSLYSDWLQSDPKLGLNKWETFLTQELPPLLAARLNSNGVNAIAGNSMGGQAAMMLAHRHPELYRGVAAFSGCYSTVDLLGTAVVQTSTSSQGGDAVNMWGPPGSREWAEHDTVAHAENLAGKELYLSAATGVPGPHETPDTPDLARTLVLGGILEAGSRMCTQRLEERLDALNIPVTVTYEPVGVHAWGYWRDQLPKAWPTLQRALETRP